MSDFSDTDSDSDARRKRRHENDHVFGETDEATVLATAEAVLPAGPTLTPEERLAYAIAWGKLRYTANKSEVLKLDFDVTAPDEESKRLKRAGRFNLLADSAGTSTPALLSTRVDRFGGHPLSLLHDAAKGCSQPPRLPGPDDVLRLASVHLYGLRHNETPAQVNAYFEGYFHSYIEWIDKSSCNLTWTDALSAKRALWAVSEPIGTTDPSQLALPEHLRWRKMYKFRAPNVPDLFLRLATTLDLKPLNKFSAAKFRALMTPGSEPPLPIAHPVSKLHASLPPRRRRKSQRASPPVVGGVDMEEDDVASGVDAVDTAPPVGLVSKSARNDRALRASLASLEPAATQGDGSGKDDGDANVEPVPKRACAEDSEAAAFASEMAATHLIAGARVSVFSRLGSLGSTANCDD